MKIREFFWYFILFALILTSAFLGCGGKATTTVDTTDTQKTMDTLSRVTIHWDINTRPQGADCYWRVKSSTPDVRNQNEKYLAPTPYESTETYDIKGLNRENAGNVYIEIRCVKLKYLDQKKVFNMLSVMDEKEISVMMRLVKE